MRTRSSPLPPLPLELKNHILRFCDPSTLAKTAQVSLAFLELSGPLLYRDITVRGVEKLKKLFRSKTLATVQPFLSLSQTSSLTYVLVPDETIADAPLSSPKSGHIFLDRLVVDVREIRWPIGRFAYVVNLDALLVSLSPSRLHVLASTPKKNGSPIYLDLEAAIAKWSNLELLFFANSAPCPPVLESNLFQIESPQRRPLDVVYDLSSAGDAFTQLLGNIEEDFGKTEALVWLGKLLLWVGSEEDKKEALALLSECKNLSIEVKVKATTI